MVFETQCSLASQYVCIFRNTPIRSLMSVTQIFVVLCITAVIAELVYNSWPPASMTSNLSFKPVTHDPSWRGVVTAVTTARRYGSCVRALFLTNHHFPFVCRPITLTCSSLRHVLCIFVYFFSVVDVSFVVGVFRCLDGLSPKRPIMCGVQH